MKTLIKVVLAIVILIIVLAGGGIAYVKTALPNVGPAPEITVEATPERLARGEYLAHNVSGCIDCGQQWTDGDQEEARTEATIGALYRKIEELTV